MRSERSLDRAPWARQGGCGWHCPRAGTRSPLNTQSPCGRRAPEIGGSSAPPAQPDEFCKALCARAHRRGFPSGQTPYYKKPISTVKLFNAGVCQAAAFWEAEAVPPGPGAEAGTRSRAKPASDLWPRTRLRQEEEGPQNRRHTRSGSHPAMSTPGHSGPPALTRRRPGTASPVKGKPRTQNPN